MGTTQIKQKRTLTEKEKQAIFKQLLEEFVIKRNKRQEREHDVLIDKIKYYTEGKEIILENTSI